MNRFNYVKINAGRRFKGSIGFDVMSQCQNIYMYSKTRIARARYQTCFDPDSLLPQCMNVVSLL
jgi:hypothetical protein